MTGSDLKMVIVPWLVIFSVLVLLPAIIVAILRAFTTCDAENRLDVSGRARVTLYLKFLAVLVIFYLVAFWRDSDQLVYLFLRPAVSAAFAVAHVALVLALAKLLEKVLRAKEPAICREMYWVLFVIVGCFWYYSGKLTLAGS